MTTVSVTGTLSSSWWSSLDSCSECIFIPFGVYLELQGYYIEYCPVTQYSVQLSTPCWIPVVLWTLDNLQGCLALSLGTIDILRRSHGNRGSVPMVFISKYTPRRHFVTLLEGIGIHTPGTRWCLGSLWPPFEPQLHTQLETLLPLFILSPKSHIFTSA